jgi:hypothetical protein
LLASSEPANSSTFDEYSLRFDIEESFRDAQSGGFQRKPSHLATPDALERLLLCISLATLYLTSFGTWIVQAQKRHWIDPYWWRGHTSLQLGWRGLRLAVPDEEPAFVPFRLDPTPDPLPVPASRRLARSSAHEQELPTAA